MSGAPDGLGRFGVDLRQSEAEIGPAFGSEIFERPARAEAGIPFDDKREDSPSAGRT